MKFDPNIHYKLMVLYLLNKIAFMLNAQQLVSFFVDNEYIDYFKLNEILNELIDTNLIESYNTNNNQKYKLTENGKMTLKYFKNELSKKELDNLDKFIKDNKFRLRTEASLSSNFVMKNDTYSVQLEINDNEKPTLTIILDIPDKEVAITICEHWNNKAQTIYNQIIKQLM